MTTQVLGANSIGTVGFLGCEIDWNVPEQTFQGLGLLIPPKASHTHRDTHKWLPD